MSQLFTSINGQKKIIINNVTKKEEEILYLFSNPISINENNTNLKNQTSVCEFLLEQKLGEGNFGTVRLGTNRQTGEKVAIKILEKSKMTKFDDKNRLEREINILSKIHQPNIVKLFCVIETDRQIFIIMEYIKGNELFQYILVKKRLDEEEACYYFLQIINCIDYLNRIKISHRDLKAENIIIEQKSKEIKMIDFGLSNLYENGQLLSTACGSPIYAAPEMLEGKLYKGSTVDIWSAGIVLYYMLCGSFPFHDVSNDKLYKKILKGKFETPKYFSKNVKDLINKILVVNPQKRISLKEIKKHPWVVNYLEKNKKFENIFKNIGLNIGKYIIPIDEDIVDEINKKYNVDKEDIRKYIIYNIINDKSTLYYLMLNKKCKEGINNIADMKSGLFAKYIKDKNNLLSTYNNDLNIIFNIRKNGTKEQNSNEIISEKDNVKILKNGIMKESQSYTNISLNNENKSCSNKKINIKINKIKNRCISAQKTNGKRNQKLNQIYLNIKNKNIENKDLSELSLNYKVIKNNINEQKNQRIKTKKFNNNKDSSNIKQKNSGNNISKNISNKKYIKISKSEKKDENANLGKGNIIKKDLNKINQEKFNKNDFIVKDYEQKSYTVNTNLEIGHIENNNIENYDEQESNDNNVVSEFDYSMNEKKEKTPFKNELDSNNYKERSDENKSRNKDDKDNNDDKDNINFNYFTLKVNNSTEKKDSNNPNNNFSNIKIKNNRLVLFKDMKSKDINNKNNSLIIKNEIKDFNKTVNEDINKFNKDIKYKKIDNMKIKNEKNKNTYHKKTKTFISKKINKINKDEFHHHKNTSLLGKTSIFMKLNDDNENKNDNKKGKVNTKQNNKSVEFKKDINYEIKLKNLNNYSAKNSNNIKINNIIIKNTKLNKNKTNRITSSVKSTVILDKNTNNNYNNIFKPYDINCLFVQNEKVIKNELIRLSENKSYKIKNIRNEKYIINFKSIDLSIELIIEKLDDLYSILKLKKIKGKNSDYINQLNVILNQIENHKKI